jgi:hypothetical protein
MITLWGPEYSGDDYVAIVDNYSVRQWAGVLSDYILPRWQTFYRQLDLSLETGEPFDANKTDHFILRQQQEWTYKTNRFTTIADKDNTVQLSQSLLEKYKPEFFHQTDNKP